MIWYQHASDDGDDRADERLTALRLLRSCPLAHRAGSPREHQPAVPDQTASALLVSHTSELGTWSDRALLPAATGHADQAQAADVSGSYRGLLDWLGADVAAERKVTVRSPAEAAYRDFSFRNYTSASAVRRAIWSASVASLTASGSGWARSRAGATARRSLPAISASSCSSGIRLADSSRIPPAPARRGGNRCDVHCQDQAEAAAAVGEPGGLCDARRGVHLGPSLALAASAGRWRAGGGDRAQAPDVVRRLPLPGGAGQVGHPG